MEQSQSNGLAVASIVLGIIALLSSCCYGGFLGFIGLILGIVAISKGQKKGMAVAGIITSVIALLITIIALAMGMSLMNEIANSSGDDVKKVSTETVGDDEVSSESASDNEADNSNEEVSTDNTAETESEYKVGDDDLSASLSSGKKAKGALYFEVPSDAQSIVLEYNDNVWTSDKIVFVVK